MKIILNGSLEVNGESVHCEDLEVEFMQEGYEVPFLSDREWAGLEFPNRLNFDNDFDMCICDDCSDDLFSYDESEYSDFEDCLNEMVEDYIDAIHEMGDEDFTRYALLEFMGEILGDIL